MEYDIFVTALGIELAQFHHKHVLILLSPCDGNLINECILCYERK